jgi:ABC-2 type transport system permease protein
VSAATVRQRPELLGSDARRFWALTWTLAATDFKLRFYGSALGIAWSLVRPFALFAVLWVVFDEIAGLGDGIHNYPAYILTTMVLFNFFAEVAGGCVNCLTARENLLRKIRFPRLVIPLSVALTALLNLGMTLIAVLGFLVLVSGLAPAVGWLQLVPVVVLVLCFALGLGLLMAALFVRFRDIQPIWDVASQMLFYASPVLYVATIVPGDYLQLYLCNPLASLFTQIRHAMIDPTASSAFEAMGWKLLVPLAIVSATLALGAWVFHREAPRAAENL